MEITVEGRTIHIAHRNATYNCCLDDIEVTLTVEGILPRLTETEVLIGSGCWCICCYDVESTVVDLWPGTYVIKYCWDDYETTDVCHTEEVEIE